MPDQVAEAEPVLGRRERKKQVLHQSLQDEALRLFSERGFEGTTIEDITEAVDVAPRTFFRYFATKDEIVLGSPERLRTAMAASLAAQDGELPVLEAVVRAVSGLDPDGRMTRSPQGRKRLQLRAEVAEQSTQVRAGLLRSYAAQEEAIVAFVAQRCGLSPTTDVFPQLVGAAVSAAIRVGLNTWLANGCRGDVDEIFREAVGPLLDGLASLQP